MANNSGYGVLFADEHLVVLNKASGILTAADRYDNTVARLDTAAEEEFGRLYAVHRIDKETSGAVIYARTAEAHRFLSMAFEQRQVKKTYHALVYGRPLWTEEYVDLKLLVDGDSRHRTVTSKKGKDSVTRLRFLGSCGKFSWIEASPETGRTHQIRVHLASKGFPIVCDSLYSEQVKPLLLSEIKRSWRGDVFDEKPLLSRLALHAYQIEFAHPITGSRLCCTAPYPKDLDAVRKQFSKIFDCDPLTCVAVSD